MRFLFTCQYCDFRWNEWGWSKDFTGKRCTRCGDRHLRVQELHSQGTDVFGYRFDPPFEDELKNEKTYD